MLISPQPDPGRKQATATKTYNTIPRLTVYKQLQYIAVVCMPKSWYSVVSFGCCGLFPSRVGLRTYQHPCNSKDNEACKIANKPFGRINTTYLISVACNCKMHYRRISCCCCCDHLSFLLLLLPSSLSSSSSSVCPPTYCLVVWFVLTSLPPTTLIKKPFSAFEETIWQIMFPPMMR